MTTEQIIQLKASCLPNNYTEYRARLRAEARRLGHKVGANDIVKVLEAKANDINRVTSTAEVTPPPYETSEKAESTPPTPSKSDASSDASSTSSDASSGASSDSECDEEEAKAKELEKRMQEMDKLKEELEKIRKEKEEKRKREAEAKRKREEEEAKSKKKHYKTDELIETLKTTGLAYLVGPAGTGKSTLAMDACEEMFEVKKEDDKFSQHFAQISFSPDTTSGEMVGRCDINGAFHKSEVVRVFGEGGVILFDEIDNADASMLVKLNTAIANGTFATPEGLVRKHPNTYIVCTANTYGTGPDAMYVGRTRLDAATLDRFVCSTIEVDYDVMLEKKLMSPLTEKNREWLAKFVAVVRDCIKTNHFRRLCSTRFVINAVKWLSVGKTQKFIKDKLLIGWSTSEVSAIESACSTGDCVAK